MTPPSWPADRPLRAWQQAAAAALFLAPGDAFLASATPAAGKTTFGLHVAHRMLSEGRVARVAVVAPTTHIARQWAADAARYGIDLEPNRPNAAGPEPRDRDGVAVTYQTVAAGPAVHRRRCAEAPTLLIADEPHHMGEQAAWGRSTVEAFARARFRLLLSGTPFRTDDTPIPWVAYDADGLSEADFAYGYTDALLDRVCRPVTFHLFDGDMEWVSDGRRRAADFGVGLGAAEAARRLRTALDPDGDWISHVLRDAVLRLERVRAGDHPDAGGLVIAADKEHAEALAVRLERIAGERPAIVTTRRAGRVGADRPLRGGERILARLGPDGLRGRRHPATARRRLRHERPHRAVLPPGRRPLHPPHARADGPDEPRLPARRSGAPAARGADRGGAPPRADARAEGRAAAEPPERVRSEPDVFRALSSSAHGEAFSCRRRSRARRCRCSPPTRRRRRARRLHRVAPVAPAPGGRAPHERRERLRDERRALVSALSRSTGEPHRAIHARVNRDTGAASVTAASAPAAREGQRAARAQTRLTSASWPKQTTDSTPFHRSSSTTSRCAARNDTSTRSSSTRR